MVGNFHSLHITHIGSVILLITCGDITLPNILLVPDLKQNLISINQLTKKFPYVFQFTAGNFVVKNRCSGVLVAQKCKRGNVYILDNQKHLALFSNRQRTTSFTIWHNRLGHCSSQTVDFLAIRKLILVNDKSGASSISSACQLGKSKRLPFVIDVNKSGHAFDMVYCDLWGLALIQSWNNYKYCVSFVDDCTRFMWYYPLRNKAEFFQVYLLFEKMIYT